MRAFLVAAAALGFAYLILIQFPSFHLTPHPTTFEGAAGQQLSERAVTLLERVKSETFALVDRQRFWQKVVIVLGVVSLAATAIATLVAALKTNESRANREEFLNKKITVIGALTALATLATGMADLVDKTGVKPLDGRIVALTKTLTTTPSEIVANPDREGSILDGVEIILKSNAA